MTVNKMKKTQEWHEQRDRERNLAIQKEENIAKINQLFSFPISFTREEMNEAMVLEDSARLKWMKVEIAKCKAKKSRIVQELKSAESAEERLQIMLNVKLDLDDVQEYELNGETRKVIKKIGKVS